jgi:hypothetical protein
MPLSEEDHAKLDTLKAIASPAVSELVAVKWPDPDGTIYYCSTLLSELPGYEALAARNLNIELRFAGNQFLDIPQDSGISDDRIDLNFWDGDERDATGAFTRTSELTRLFQTHGAGAKVEVYYYFPQFDLLLLEWWGHLQPPADGTSIDWLKCTAEFGFMSSMLPLPRRSLMFASCQEMFGGLLQTQEEIDEGGCAYNRQLNAATLEVPDPVNATNVDTSGGGATKDAGGSAWNAGASFGEVNAEDNAVIEVTVGTGYAAAGFCTTASPINGNTDILFGVQWNPDGQATLRGVDSGHSYANATSWTAGDVFRIEKRSGVFRLFKNASLVAPSAYAAPEPVYPLYLGIAIFTPGAGASAINTAIGGDIGSGPSVGLLDPDTGLPFPSCPRNNRAACAARLGDSLSYLAGDTIIESHIVNQTKGPAITTTSRGNESTLKRPLRVIAGQRHVTDLDLMAYTIEPDTKHPEGGAAQVLFSISEGPNKSVTNVTVNGNVVGAQHLNVRLGLKRQQKTGFSVNVNNYSSTSLLYARVQGDFTKATADDFKAECDVEGLTDVRVYSDQTHFTEQYSFDRAWWLEHVMRNKRWGWGINAQRIWQLDMIALSAWWAETVTVTDRDGNTTTGPRSLFHAELIDRTAQQQINDICLAGRCSLPFPDNSGYMRVVPLKRLTGDELAAAPLFTDRGENRNIVWDGPAEALKTTLTRSSLSDKDLPNRIVVTYDDAEHDHKQVPLTFEDVDQQLATGRAFGDFTRNAVEKSYTAFGVTEVGECGRLGNLLLDLGEFDEGGLKNNLRVQFTTWWAFTVELQKYQVIKVESDKLDVVNAVRVSQGLEPFIYFRIRTKRRMSDLKVEVSAQAYPVAYYERLESAELPPPISPSFPLLNPGGGTGVLPFTIGFDSIEHTEDRINVKLSRDPLTE